MASKGGAPGCRGPADGLRDHTDPLKGPSRWPSQEGTPVERPIGMAFSGGDPHCGSHPDGLGGRREGRARRAAGVCAWAKGQQRGDGGIRRRIRRTGEESRDESRRCFARRGPRAAPHPRSSRSRRALAQRRSRTERESPAPRATHPPPLRIHYASLGQTNDWPGVIDRITITYSPLDGHVNCPAGQWPASSLRNSPMTRKRPEAQSIASPEPFTSHTRISGLPLHGRSCVSQHCVDTTLPGSQYAVSPLAPRN